MNCFISKVKDLLLKLKVTDWIIIAGIALALVVGLLTFFHFRGTADKQIEAQSMIGFQVFLRGVTLTGSESPLRPNDETFITIRNVPYTNLRIADVKIDSKKTILPNPRPGKDAFIMMEDVSQAFLYDIVVTLVVENAKITKDGAVIGGNKIKIGLPVTLEGPNYKLNGTVSDVRILQPKADESEMQKNTSQPQDNNALEPDVNKQEQNLN
ncbi:DUF4330 domain-containing protein [bacterium]|nr:DUF4330 domain-containing protein [bacterium]